MATRSDVTLLLERLQNGDSAASEALIPLLDAELRGIAARPCATRNERLPGG